MSERVIDRVLVGEALVGEGHEVAHIDLVLGPRGSAVEAAFCNCLTNNKDGFTSLLAIIEPNLQVKPSTVVFNKVKIRHARHAQLLFGAAQKGVARAVVDCVAEGIIPRQEANDVFICAGVFLHWEAREKQVVEHNNHAAMKLALQRAVSGAPAVDELLQHVRGTGRQNGQDR